MGNNTLLIFVWVLGVVSCITATHSNESHYHDMYCEDVQACVCYMSGYDYVAECVGSELTYIPDNLSFNITVLSVHATSLYTVILEDLEHYEFLVGIRLDNNNISYIDPDLLENYPNLKTFTIQGNSLLVLDTALFSSNRKLVTFDASSNFLYQVPELSGLGSLEFVNLSSNEIQSLPGNFFSGCQKVDELYLDNNLLTSLNSDFFEDMPLLDMLHLSNNNLNSLTSNSFSGLYNINFADLHGNKITSLGTNLFPDSGSSLIVLDLSDNQLSLISSGVFSQIPNVDYLDLNGNQLTTIPAEVSNLNKLTKLHLSRNLFTTLPPRGFDSVPQLTELFLSSMDTLQTVDTEAFHGLSELERLSLSDNRQLVEFTREHLSPNENPNLAYLYLDRCSFVYLSEVVFSQFPDMNLVDLYGNKLNCSCDLKWMARVVADEVVWARHWEDSSTPPTCNTPTHLYDYPIPTMKEEDMTCNKLTIERISPPSQSIHIRRNANFTAHLYTGLPDSVWIAPGNKEVVPFPEGETPFGLRVHATWRLIETTNAIEAVFNINNVSTNDEGSYRLVATNIAGNVTMDFNLDVVPYELTLPPQNTEPTDVSQASTLASPTLTVFLLICAVVHYYLKT